MKKRLLLALTLLSFIWIPARAQSFYADLSYQSFRPFIHFQLEIGNRRPRYNTYRSSYLKGYMDGVNGTYYSDYRFYDLVRQINAYEAGYRDGQRDQQLVCRLHGYRRLPRRPFSYSDYYAPQVSVQIWLNDLTFTFLRAPERRLPRYWARRAQPSLRRYRSRFKQKRYFAQAERRFKRNQHQLKRRAQDVRRKYQRNNKGRRIHHSANPRRLNKKRATKRLRNQSRTADRRINHNRTSRRKRRQISGAGSNHKDRAPKTRPARIRRKQKSHARPKNRRVSKKQQHSNTRQGRTKRQPRHRRNQNQPQKVRRHRARNKHLGKSHQRSKRKAKKSRRRKGRNRRGH